MAQILGIKSILCYYCRGLLAPEEEDYHSGCHAEVEGWSPHTRKIYGVNLYEPEASQTYNLLFITGTDTPDDPSDAMAVFPANHGIETLKFFQGPNTVVVHIGLRDEDCADNVYEMLSYGRYLVMVLENDDNKRTLVPFVKAGSRKRGNAIELTGRFNSSWMNEKHWL
jgi:hypothetical protein